MSALYISQLIGQHLSIGQQLIVILTSIFASVGLLTQYIALRRCIIYFTGRQKAPCFRTRLSLSLFDVANAVEVL